jgi:hypothetical protein
VFFWDHLAFCLLFCSRLLTSPQTKFGLWRLLTLLPTRFTRVKKQKNVLNAPKPSNLEALKCRYCGETFSNEEVEKAKEESWRKDYNDPKFCPFCRKKGVILNAFIPGGGFGSWCPNCKKTIERLNKIPPRK